MYGINRFLKQKILDLWIKKREPTRVGVTPSGTIVGASIPGQSLYFVDEESSRLLPWSCTLYIDRYPDVPSTVKRPRLLGIGRGGALYLQNVDRGLQIFRIGETVEVIMDMPTVSGIETGKPLLKNIEVSYGMGEIGLDWLGDKWLLDVEAIPFYTAPLWNLLAGPRPVMAATG